MKFTIMSYRNHSDSDAPAYSFQLYDIAALHRLYGRSEGNAGDTSYDVFHEHEPTDGSTHIGGALAGSFTRIFSIWDATGDDTIDASQSLYGSSHGHAGVLIDLRPGFFSSIAEDTKLNVAGSTWDPGVQNVSIAFGAYIENATGGARDDVLIGNLLNNRLRGGAGNDLIFAEGRLRPDATGGEVTDGEYEQLGEQGYSQVGADAAAFVSDPRRQVDRLFGEADDDQLWGGRGDDELDGGMGSDLLHGWEGDDTAIYDFGSGSATLRVSAGGAPDARVQANPNAPDPQVAVQATVVIGSDTDTLIDIEKIELTGLSDTVTVTGLGDVNAPPPMEKLKIDFLGSPTALNVDLLDFSDAGVANAWLGKNAGIKVDLRNAADQSVRYYYVLAELPTGQQLSWTQSDVQLHAANANSVKGTEYADWLIGNGGRRADGEGFSTLHGQGGNDSLQAAGWETHMYGGAGNDTFRVGKGAWIEDAEAHDRVTYGGFPIFGGSKQWWMEGNTAYWAPFSTVMGAFPVIGSSLLTAAAIFVDVAAMKFAQFERDAAGNLVIYLGWGHGGFGVIADYRLDLDSGVASAGVTVFQAEAAEDFSFSNLRQYLNLALKAGFGVGMGGFDPLVLDLDGDGFELTSEGNSRVYFEFDGDGFGERTGWVRGDDGLLARDANTNGAIDDVTELFGNRTQSGFAALGAFDLNADGVIDAQDAVFSELRVWRDADQDGVTDAGELKTLAELGIVSISLSSAAPAQPTAIGGNQILRTGSFARADGTTGSVGDVAFAINETATRWLGDSTVSASAAALPQLRGFGELKDLRLAMTGVAALEAMVSAFAANATTDLAVLKADAEAILYAWAGVSGVAATAIGTGGFDARKLAFLEKYAGQTLMPRDAGGAVQTTNVEEMEALWSDQLTRLTLRLVVQGPLAEAFEGISYRTDLDLLVAETASALEDLYGRILADLPSDHGAALAEWQAWAPLLGAMADGMRRFDANVVRSDYVAAQLLAAADGVAQPLSFAELAGALGVGELRIGTGAAETLARGGASGTVVYAGQGGNDLFDGGGGQDVYVFGRTIGQSVIDDEEANASGDRIRFAFLAPSDVRLERSGNDLLITVTATGETVRVIGQFAPVVPLAADVLLSSNKGVEDIQFADGTIYEIPEIMTAVGTGTDGNDHIVGTMHSDVLIGGLGNDRLEGGDDADLYVVRGGDGEDVIRDVQSNPLLRAADLVIFGDGIAPSDLVFVRAGSGGDDLLVEIGSAGQTLLIEGQFAYSVLGYNDRLAPNSRIEAFGFRDYGDNWSTRDVQQMMIAQETTAGDDETLGFGDDDQFAASAGNDLMIGLDGADLYLWGRGSGHDVIDEQSRFIDVKVGMMGLSLVDEADTVEFLAGIVRSDVSFTRPGEAPDLLVTILSTGETLLVKDQFGGFQTGPLGAQWFDRIEWFKFADGTKLSWQQVLAETTTGGAGDDRLWGDLYPDLMRGGAGNDTLSGRGYGDSYRYDPGDGADVLLDSNPSILGAGILQLDTAPDILSFGAGIAPGQISFERAGKDLVLIVGTTGGRVTLAGQDDYFHTGVFGAHSSHRIEEVRFDDGTLWTWQDLNRFAIAAATTANDDVATGFMMEDRFEASAGNDVLAGGDSADVYVFGPGSGQDIVRESVSNVLYGDEDVVEFAPGILPTDVTFARVGADLVLSLATGDTLTVEGEFHYENWFQWRDVELFRFENGTVWTKDWIQVQLLRSTAGADHLLGFMTDDDLDGGAGNDILEGGDGSDTYRFGYGSGHDLVSEWVSNANLANNDRLVFAANVVPANVGLSREGDDLVITLAGSGETLRVEGHFSFVSWFAWRDIESFEFADGTVWSDLYVASRIMGGTSGPDHIVGTFRADTLDGGAGNDILEGGDGDDRYVFGPGYGQDEIREGLSNANLGENDQLQFLPGIALADLSFARSGDDLLIGIANSSDSLLIKGQFAYSNWYTWWDIDRFLLSDGTTLSKEEVQQIVLTPTSGNDHLLGFMTDDLLDGGAGDDLLEGGDGSDTYVFGLGGGDDEIREWVTNVNLGNADVLRFGPGITVADLTFERQDDDLLITIAATGDSILITDQFRYSNWFTWWDIESFIFETGPALTSDDVQRMLLTGTSGPDHILGFMTDDVIDGGAGNDILEGADGADTYVFGRGSGQDEVREWLGNANIGNDDTIRFGPDVAWSDLTFARDGDTLVIGIAGTSDTIRIVDQWRTINDRSSNTWWDVENYLFEDGTSKTIYDIQVKLLASTDGDDRLVGFFTDDTLTGGKGNDLLEGSRGNDVYVHNRFDGHDTVTDFYLASGNDGDRIVFGPDIAPGDVTVRRSATRPADMVLSVKGGESSVTITGQITGGREYTIDFVEFVGGTVWTKDVLANMLTSGAATAGDDLIDGTTLADQINSGAGNDRVRGLGGNDTLDGGLGNDRLEGAEGDDTYVYFAGGGDDVVSEYVITWGSYDTIDLRGIAYAELAVSRSGADFADMVLTFGTAGGSIVIDNQFTDNDWGVDRVLVEGTEVTAAALNALYFAAAMTGGADTIEGGWMADTIRGGAGDDVLRGMGGNDLLEGGFGNDRLEGVEGDDTYFYVLGDGDDLISEYVITWGSFDTLDIRGELVATDLIVARGGADFADMILSFANAPGSVVVDNQFLNNDWGIDRVLLNGTELSATWLNDTYFAASMTVGADTIIGGWMNDTIRGGGGDDILRGAGGSDLIEGGIGNDRLEGVEGDDTYVYRPGDGDDVISDYVITWGSYNILQLGGDLDESRLIVRRSPTDASDLVLSFTGIAGSVTIDNQWLNNDWGINVVTFSNGAPSVTAARLNEIFFAQAATGGADLIEGSYFADAINGLAGDDVLKGWGGSDTLDGGAGDDRLEGETGDDIYLYSVGGGHDVISDFTVRGSFNSLRFGPDITPENLRFAPGADLSDMVISFANASGSITIDNHILGGRDWGIDEIRFANAPTWTAATILAEYAARQGTSASETLGGTNNGETLSGREGDDVVKAFAGNDTLIGGTGNDQLEGGEGLDIYRYSPGDGDDVILDSGGSRDNRLVLVGIAPGDVLLSRTPQDPSDLRISFKTLSGSILIDNETSSTAGVEFIEFGDGTVLSGAALAAQIGPGSGGPDTINGTSGDDSLWGLEGNDTIAAGGGSDTLVGGAGDDVLWGDVVFPNLLVNGSFETAGTVVGGGSWGTAASTIPGWTKTNASPFELVLSGYSGVASTDGSYWLDMDGQGSSAGSNMNISQTVSGRAAGEALVLTFDAANYASVQSGSFDVLWNGAIVASYSPADKVMRGYRLDLTAVQGDNVLGFRGTGTADTVGATLDNVKLTATVVAGPGNDLLKGGTGADVLNGGTGDDSYTFALGDGADRLTERAGEGFDVIVFGPGIAPSALSFATAANGRDVVMSIAGTSDSITFVDGAVAATIGVEEFRFADAPAWDQAAIESRVPRYTSGPDVIVGTAAADTLYGGGGDDQLSGLGGADTLHGGDGNDRLVGGVGDDFLYGNAGADVFQVSGSGEGLDWIDGGADADRLEATAAGTVIGVTYLAGVETITAGNFTGVYIAASANADTVDLTVATLYGIGRVDLNAGNDIFVGSTGIDTVIGGAGDDTLSGGGNNDVFQVSGTTGGFDAVDGGAGTADVIQATTGATMIGLRSVTGVETISSAGFTGVYISGSAADDTLSFLNVALNGIVRIEGGAGNDTLTGNNTINTIWGGIGNDRISGDAGNDVLVGDDGDDVLIGGLGNDNLNGGLGVDTVDYSAATAAWTINLAAASSQAVSGKEVDTISNVENVVGGAGIDTITGTAVANVLNGGGNNDRITGGAGNDRIEGGAGTDVAVFAGLQASYSIATSAGTIQIVDNQPTTDGNDGTDTLLAVEKAEFKGGVQVSLATPVILDLDGDGETLVDRSRSHARFDWDGDGQADFTGWMGTGDGMLVFDRDGDGTVSGAHELSFVDDRHGARSDLDGLAAFDMNGDGLFSDADGAWADFRIWNDRNGNGRAEKHEVLTMEEAGVAAISLAGEATEQMWAMTDNIVVNRGEFVRADGSRAALVDVALNYESSGGPAAPPSLAFDEVPLDTGVRFDLFPYINTMDALFT
jgi:Ca2+-binding RTX toxin-like protein